MDFPWLILKDQLFHQISLHFYLVVRDLFVRDLAVRAVRVEGLMLLG